MLTECMGKYRTLGTLGNQQAKKSKWALIERKREEVDGKQMDDKKSERTSKWVREEETGFPDNVANHNIKKCLRFSKDAKLRCSSSPNSRLFSSQSQRCHELINCVL